LKFYHILPHFTTLLIIFERAIYFSINILIISFLYMVIVVLNYLCLIIFHQNEMYIFVEELNFDLIND